MSIHNDECQKTAAFLSLTKAVPKLTGTKNFILWHGQVLLCARMFGIARVLEAPGDWGVFERYGFALITLSVSQDVLQMLYMKGFGQCPTAYAAMGMLYDTFLFGGDTEVAGLEKQFRHLDAGKYESLWAYLADARHLVFRLTLVKRDMEEEYIAERLLSGLLVSKGPNRKMWDRNPLQLYYGLPPLENIYAHLEDLARTQALSMSVATRTTIR